MTYNKINMVRGYLIAASALIFIALPNISLAAVTDCTGKCVPEAQCGSADRGTLTKDSTKEGTCAEPLYLCCKDVIVTPQGEAPGTAEADAAQAAEDLADEQVDQPIGSPCKEKTTGLVVPCVADGSPTAVIVGIIARVINWLLTLSGTLFLVMFVWGGISYMIAGGDSAAAGKAQKILVNAVIGVAIVLFSYVILDYIFSSFIGAL